MPEPLAVWSRSEKRASDEEEEKAGGKLKNLVESFWRAQLNLRLKWGRKRWAVAHVRKTFSSPAALRLAGAAVAQVGGWFYKRNCAHLWESVSPYEHTGPTVSIFTFSRTPTNGKAKRQASPSLAIFPRFARIHHLKIFLFFSSDFDFSNLSSETKLAQNFKDFSSSPSFCCRS